MSMGYNANNHSLNLSNSEEIVFVSKRRRHKFGTAKTLDGLRRVKNIKILGIAALTNSLSINLIHAGFVYLKNFAR